MNAKIFEISGAANKRRRQDAGMGGGATRRFQDNPEVRRDAAGAEPGNAKSLRIGVGCNGTAMCCEGAARVAPSFCFLRCALTLENFRAQKNPVFPPGRTKAV